MHNQGLMRERQRGREGGGVGLYIIYHIVLLVGVGEETLLGGGTSSVLNKNVQ